MNEFPDDSEMDDEWMKPKMEGWMDSWMIYGAIARQMNQQMVGRNVG